MTRRPCLPPTAEQLRLAQVFADADAAERAADGSCGGNPPLERARSLALVALVGAHPCRQCDAEPGQPCTGRPRVLDVLWGCPGAMLRAHLPRMGAARRSLAAALS